MCVRPGQPWSCCFGTSSRSTCTVALVSPSSRLICSVSSTMYLFTPRGSSAPVLPLVWNKLCWSQGLRALQALEGGAALGQLLHAGLLRSACARRWPGAGGGCSPCRRASRTAGSGSASPSSVLHGYVHVQAAQTVHKKPQSSQRIRVDSLKGTTVRFLLFTP